MYYFDNAATTFPKPQEVYDKIYSVMTEYGANPGRSGHSLAIKAGREIYATRDNLSRFFNAGDPFNIVFTSSATESLNIAIQGALKPGDHIITTSMEHNSILRPIKELEKIGVEHTIIWANKLGQIDPNKIKDAIRDNTKMIATTHISNLTGTIIPIEDIAKIAREYGIIYLVDAAQSAGVYEIDIRKKGIDLLAFPGHKSLLGPQGTGGLFIKEGLEIAALVQGGTGSDSHSLTQPSTMPDKFESGTPNTPGIIGLGEGIHFINKTGISNIRKHEEELTEHFIREASKINGLIIYGPKNIHLQAAVVSINFDNMDSSELAYILNEEFDIYVRPGLHCAPLAHKTIGTFEQGAVRFSFGFFNNHKDIEYSIKALNKIRKEL